MSKSLLSRLIQFKKFQSPSFVGMGSLEWIKYLGKQLVLKKLKFYAFSIF
jgi:hypothetical protein